MPLYTKNVAPPLISLFIFSMGSGLLSTLTTLRLYEINTPALLIGAMMSVFYLGLIVGTFRFERLLKRVGHIRTFSASAAVITSICVIQGMFVQPYVWILLRLIAGFATAGLFMVVESWLLIKSDVSSRGKILALYMICYYLSQSIGQLLINMASTQTLQLFAVSSMLTSMAIIPLTITKIPTPIFDNASPFEFTNVLKKAGLALTICFGAGLLVGSFYGVLPLYLADNRLTTGTVGSSMAIAILGAMFLQYPIGMISDLIGRRFALILICLFGSVFSVMMLVNITNAALLNTLLFVLGGCVFTIYPVTVSFANDVIDESEILSASQTLILTMSTGACLGPLVSSLLIALTSKKDYLLFNAVLFLSMLIYTSWRKLTVASTEIEQEFMMAPQSTPLAVELDPRMNEESD